MLVGKDEDRSVPPLMGEDGVYEDGVYEDGGWRREERGERRVTGGGQDDGMGWAGYCHAKPDGWLAREAAARVSELDPICCEARRS